MAYFSGYHYTPPPLAGEGWGGGERVQMNLCACPLDLVACPFPIPPAEVGYIRLPPTNTNPQIE